MKFELKKKKKKKTALFYGDINYFGGFGWSVA